jgi:hypothetical protein
MPMRKTRTRARRLRTGPTSRPSDLVCLLFSRGKCDPALDFVQAYSSVVLRHKSDIWRRPDVFAISPSKGNAADEDW